MCCQGTQSLLISPVAPLMALLEAAHFQLIPNNQILIFTSCFQAEAERELGAVCAEEWRWQELMPSLILKKETNICPLRPCVTLGRDAAADRHVCILNVCVCMCFHECV